MWRRFFAFVLFVGVASTAGAWYMTKPRPLFEHATLMEGMGGNLEHGRDIFNAADCASCHATPGQGDRLKLGGGLALTSPFGTFRPPNISPDPIDGIGRWTVTDLANALIVGISPTEQHYYPAFPYTSYTGMTLVDINDLFAYLRTLPPVSGRAPPHHPSILFATRRFVGFWKLLFFEPAEPDATEVVSDAPLERGRYLVETLSHCAECHSSRNMFGAIKQNARFAGGIDPQGTGFVPNVTPIGIGDWSENDIVEMLKTGNTPKHGRVGSSMADVVTNTAMLPDEDRRAIAQYIKSLPPLPTPRP